MKPSPTTHEILLSISKYKYSYRCHRDIDLIEETGLINICMKINRNNIF